jgi:CubicO group peptidase (beta-lactamase class C family)
MLLAAAAAVAACSESTTPAASADEPIPERYRAFATTFDQERQALGVPGAAVALIERGEVTFTHGFGTKGPNSDEPLDADTLFRVGSMTKALTATALLGLVESRDLDLDAKLTHVVPDVALDGNATPTIRQLLSHQSGLYDYLTVDGPTEDAALDDFLTSPAFAESAYSMVPPGTFYNYSNPDYYLAGLALERLGGVSYPRAVTERVFSPLGMTRSFFQPSEVLADGNFTDGASTTAEGEPWDVAPDSYDNAWARPAGYAFSSVGDYAKFVQFLYAGNPAVLADEEREEMLSPQVDMLSPGGTQAHLMSYGFGTVITREFAVGGRGYARDLIWHDGSIAGFASSFFLLPSTGFGMVWFANATEASFNESLALALSSFGDLEDPTTWPPPGLAVDTTVFPSYAGTYDDPDDLGQVTATASDGTLSIGIPSFEEAGLPYEPLLEPTSMDNFAVTVDGAPFAVTFIADSTGTYEWLRTRFAVAERVPSDG